MPANDDLDVRVQPLEVNFDPPILEGPDREQV